MKSKKNIKAAVVMTLVVSLVSASFISCDWMINKKHNNDNIFGTNKTRIEIKKDEAKLLVMASQNNLDVIELCQLIKDTKTKSSIKKLANDLENTHAKIFNEYEELAEEKLISIPKHANITTDIKYNSDNTLIKENLKLITKKINKQIILLNKLAKTTNNEDFRALSKKANSVLKSKLAKTEDSLNKLRTNKTSQINSN